MEFISTCSSFSKTTTYLELQKTKVILFDEEVQTVLQSQSILKQNLALIPIVSGNMKLKNKEEQQYLMWFGSKCPPKNNYTNIYLTLQRIQVKYYKREQQMP